MKRREDTHTRTVEAAAAFEQRHGYRDEPSADCEDEYHPAGERPWRVEFEGLADAEVWATTRAKARAKAIRSLTHQGWCSSFRKGLGKIRVTAGRKAKR